MPEPDPHSSGNPRTLPCSRTAPGGLSHIGKLSRRMAARAALLASASLYPGSAALAAGVLDGANFGALEVIQLAIFAGAMGAALLSAVWLIRERARMAAQNLELRGRIAEMGSALQRTETLLNLKDTRVVIWTGKSARPDIAGSLSASSGAPDERSAFLAFGRWLTAASAKTLDHAVEAMRSDGARFDLVVETQAGPLLEVQGRVTPQQTLARFLALSARQEENARLRLSQQHLVSGNDLLRGLLDALPFPFWQRGADGKLIAANAAYARAVDCPAAATAIAENRELFGTQARELIALRHETAPVFAQTVSTVIAGDRRLHAVTDLSNENGSAGLSVDVSETENVRAELKRTLSNHSDTLDQLNTAVAIFDSSEKLRFYNQAFQKLWDLDSGFLDSKPDNTLFLDRLRSQGKLAEMPEWRRWKDDILSAYRSLKPQEHWWHLPDGRTFRVIANPQPQGGVTWVFENLTERIDLESRYNTAIKVQGETIDNLAEGVAVFGLDGKLRLWNPAFVRLWSLDPEEMVQGVHISTVAERCGVLAGQSPWPEFIALATGFDDERRDRHGRTALKNGAILSHAIIPLPNGQVMLTFVDVTDSANVERALQEKNEALQKADKLKNDFVQHVSYELRSPLTNIIGFTDLLGQEATGPLNAKQADYVSHISVSSAALMTIINDILDLATIDAGVMELEIAEVSVSAMISEAAALISERFGEHAITLKTDLAAAPASFFADAGRVRQVLFNLLANAANYAPENSEVTLACRKTPDGLAFSVADKGPGIPADILDDAFSRFQQQPRGSRKRGAGLGLSIVKSFVELHGGTVEIRGGGEPGAEITCRFPLAPAGFRIAAE